MWEDDMKYSGLRLNWLFGLSALSLNQKEWIKVMSGLINLVTNLHYYDRCEDCCRVCL
jgi:hypothetical protein